MFKIFSFSLSEIRANKKNEDLKCVHRGLLLFILVPGVEQIVVPVAFFVFIFYVHRLQGQVHRYFLKKFLFWAVKVGMFAGVCTYHQTIRQQNEQLMCLHKRQNVNTGGRDHSAPHTKLQPLAVSRTQSQAVPPPSRHQTLLEEEDTSLCNVQASNVYIVYDMCRLDIYNCDFYSSKNCAMFTAEDELKGFQIRRLKNTNCVRL